MQPRKMTEEELDEVLASLPLRDAAKVRRHINALEAEATQHNLQAKVRRFHDAMGAAVPPVPTMPESEVLELRAKLTLEEAVEFVHACGFRVVPERHGGLGLEAVCPPDFVAMARENTDILYVAMGNACAMGVEASEVFAEVDDANMRKFPGGVPLRRADGKVLKPEGWQPPDVAAVLARQGWRQK